LIVLRVYSSQRSPRVVGTVGPELGQPDRTLRQEDDQEHRRDSREYEKYHVDCLPLEQRSDGGGE